MSKNQINFLFLNGVYEEEQMTTYYDEIRDTPGKI
jgi:hypothetical protein